MSPFYSKWLQEVGFTPREREAIIGGWECFYDANQVINRSRKRVYSTTEREATQSMTEMVAKATTRVLYDAEFWAEEWPADFRRKMNSDKCAEYAPYSSPVEIPVFHSWARPRDAEKRNQAIAVWASMISFLIFHWHDYGADRELESMGLELSWELKDGIDDIRTHATEGRLEVLREAIKEFLSRAITHAGSTARTNPVAWWLAVLIQTEVVDGQPSWAVAGMKDELDFSQKLEAIDHYSRVMVLYVAFLRWMFRPASSKGGTREDKDAVCRWSFHYPTEWIHEDRDRPRNKETEALEEESQKSLEWEACRSFMFPFLAEWLTDRTTGPMADVIRLDREELVLFEKKTKYAVKGLIWSCITTDPADPRGPLVAPYSCDTIREANQAAKEWVTKLGREFVQDENACARTAAVKYDEVYDSRGEIRIRAIYRDKEEHCKVVEWVEEIEERIRL